MPTFTSVAQRLLGLKELRLPIGNTTNRETVETLANGFRRLDLAADTSTWEREIDERVYKLYGLTAEEIKIVEGVG